MSDRTSALTTSSTAADTRFADEMLRRARALDASLAAGKASAVPASRPAVRTLARPAGTAADTRFADEALRRVRAGR
ncbi:hypothetical protein [Streptomyces erythrochromogenes]|uniref:hypothetical protein n=1 Tax=Streptomyces erythrochromogenes TaxID=285574 RepID=UPI0038660068|nr:hypothetical protein OG364_29640 [Streptomyces erythrochromogenes]